MNSSSFHTLCVQKIVTDPKVIVIYNWYGILELAWKLKADRLKNAVLKFVRENDAEVKHSVGWKKLTGNEDLLADFLTNR
jgi:hypothetical protein